MSSVKALPVGHVSNPMYVVTDRSQHEASAQYKRPPYPQLPGGSSSHTSSPSLAGLSRGYPYPTEPPVVVRSTSSIVTPAATYPTSVAAAVVAASTNSSSLMPPHHHPTSQGGTNSIYAANHMYRDAHFQVDSRSHQTADIHSLDRYAEQRHHHHQQQQHQQQQQQQQHHHQQQQQQQHQHHARRRPTLKPTPEWPTIERERANMERERYLEAVRYHSEREAVVGSPYTNATIPRAIKPLVVSVHTPSEMDIGQPGKRPRLAVEPKAPVHQPLVIDTRNIVIKKEQAYTPQVEAISPTLPSEEGRCDSPMRILKENILGNINRLDKEINQVESQVTKLQKKLHDLEVEASKPSVSKEAVKDNSQIESKQMSIAQIIYSENRAKAVESHAILEKLGPKVEIPMYNQPSDTAVYHENKRKFMTFKSRLTKFFKKQHRERGLREAHLTETYSKLMQEWVKRVEKKENNTTKKAKDAKLREFFEKQFPELKKQREDKERITRVSQRIRSDAEWEEIIDGLQEQELEEKKMRSYAVIPPIRLDSRQRRISYINRNGLVEDLSQEYKEKQMLNIWTDQEKEIFREKYLQHPKNFSLIASYLDRKTVADCVQYYYLTKKSENYKQLLRKHNVRKRTRAALVKPQSQQHVQSGITTRQQEDAKAAAVNLSTSGASSSASEATTSTVTSTDASNTILTSSSPLVITSDSVTVSSAQTASTVTSSMGSPSGTAASDANSGNSKAETKKSDGNEKEKIHLPNNVRKKKEVSKKAEAAEKGAASDSDDATNDHRNQNGPLPPCTICKLEIDNLNQSRPLTKSNCNMFGIKESDLVGEMRVCSSCRFKTVRRRCPIPSCKTPKRKVKRLRPLPTKLSELSKDAKDSIVSEFQIPPEVSKCCSACFNRITRKLESSVVPENEPTENLRWTEEEMELFKKSLKQFGTDWDAISGAVSSKNKEQCRNFYFNYKRKLGLEDLLKEKKGDSGKESGKQDDKPPPIVTDEEESGETTSSCEEDNCADRCSSDTASAPSPAEKVIDDDKTEERPVPGFLSTVNSPAVAPTTEDPKAPPLSQLDSSPKIHADYDSSATVSADESQNPNDGEIRESSPRIIPNTSQSGVKSSQHDTARKTFNPPVLKEITSRPIESNVPLVKTLLQDPNIGSGHSEVTRPAYLDQPAPQPKGKEEPTCVRDLIYQAIEMSLQWPAKPGRNSSPVPASSSSGIGSKDGPEVVHVEPKKEYLENQPAAHPPTAHLGSHRPSRPGSHSEVNVVECEVQDLSKKSRPKDNSPPRDYIKRDRITPRPPSETGSGTHGHIYGPPPPAHSNQYRSSQPPPALSPHYVSDSHIDPYYIRSGEPRSKVYPLAERPHSQPPHLVAQASSTLSSTPPLQSHPKTVVAKPAVPPPPPLIASKPTQLSPKLPYKERLLTVPPSGSITQGTPVNQQPMPGGPALGSGKYEGFLRQLPPPQSKDGGSITLGTPVQHEQPRRVPASREVMAHIAPAVYDPGVVEYFRHVAPGQPYMYPPGIPGYPASAVPPRPPYANESQLNSKQIMIDFNTSKQMQLRRGITGDKEVKVSPRGSESAPTAPPESHLHPMYPPVNYQGSSSPYVNQLPANFQPGSDSRFGLLRAPMSQIDRNHSPSRTESPVNAACFPHPGKRSPGLAAGVNRQNVIHRSITWGTGKPSVIQSPQSSSPRTGEEQSSPAMNRKSTPSPRHPQPLIYQPVPPSGHDAFNTLVNAAAAQPSLVIPKDGKGSPSSRQETKSPRDRPVVEGLEKTLIDMHQRPRSYTDSMHRSSHMEHGRSNSEHSPSEAQQHLLGISADGHRFVASAPHPGYDMSRESPRHLDRQQVVANDHSSNIRLGNIREPFSREQFERQMRQPESLSTRERSFTEKEHERSKQPPPPENNQPQNYSGHSQVSDLDNEASKIFSQSFQKDVPRSGSSPRGFTAANLIDAIITRQINQNAENTAASKSSSVDLFNQYHASYEAQKAQQRSSGSKGAGGGNRAEVVTIDDEPESEKSVANWNDRPRSRGRSSPASLNSGAQAVVPVMPVPYGADKVVTLGEHIAAIISKDYNNPSDGHQPQPYFSSSQMPGAVGVSAGRVSSFGPSAQNSGSKQLEGIAAALPTEGMISGSNASRESPDHSPQNCPGNGCIYHTHSWKLRRALQQDKEREHRSPVGVDGPHSRPMSAQAIGSPINQDERQIIRVSQTSSPSMPPQVRSSPVTPYGVEPISPPGQSADSPPESKSRSKLPATSSASEIPHGPPTSWTPGPGISGLMAARHIYGQEYPDGPPIPHFVGTGVPSQSNGGLPNRSHQQQQLGLSPLDYVKNKIVEVMRTATDENPDGESRRLHSEEREPSQHSYKIQSSGEREAVSERPCSAGSGIPQHPSQRFSPAVSRYSPVPPRPSSAADRVPSRNSTPVELQRHSKRSVDGHSIPHEWHDGASLGRTNSMSLSPVNLDPKEMIPRKKMRSDSTFIPESSIDHGAPVLIPEGATSIHRTFSHGEAPRLSMNSHGHQSSDIHSSKNSAAAYAESYQTSSGQGCVENQDFRNMNDREAQWNMVAHERALESRLHSKPGVESVSPPTRESLTKQADTPRSEANSSVTSSNIACSEPSRSSPGMTQGQRSTLTSSSHGVNAPSMNPTGGHYPPFSAAGSGGISSGSAFSPATSLQTGQAPNQHLAYSSFSGMSATYAYPYSALTMRSLAAASGSASHSSVAAPSTTNSNTVVGSHAPPVVPPSGASRNSPSPLSRSNQPPPLLSSQYEPLSDED